MRNELYIKNFNAAGPVEPFRFAVFGSHDTEAAQATGATAAIIGVTDSLGADAAGDPMDVVMGGVAEVVYGGTVTRGARLTAAADGRAVVADTAADNVAGIAMMAGEAGDHGAVMIDRSVV